MLKFLYKIISVIFVVSLIFVSCDFFADGELEQTSDNSSIRVTSIKLNKSKLELKVGSMEYISISYNPNNAKPEPSFVYDKNVIEVSTQSNGIVIKGIAEGQSEISVSADNCSATCIATVTGYEPGYEKIIEPYIYSNTNILQLSPGLSEKVFVSLYGGSAADINNYTWSVEDSNVCAIDPSGQYGLIKAKSAGYTRIKVSHTRAAYPYYMGVYVFEDPSKTTYITTSNNILTMNQDDNEQTISVSLVNAKETSLNSNFKWEIINDNSSETCPIGLVANENKAVVTPKKSGKSGYCTIRVTHPDATYPLDILCRVITIVQNVYIEPDISMCTLNGDKEEKITSILKNIELGDYSKSDFSYQIVNPEIAEIVVTVEDCVYVKGKKNGSTKLIISHPKSAYTREILLISTNQIADAIDSSCYITTTNNYVRTKVGNPVTEINVSLKGGEDGDEKDFAWTVESYAADESSAPVISLETPTGDVYTSRAAYMSYSYGNAFITPLKEGTAIIKVTHPKVLYPTEILVKVLSKDAVLSEPLYFAGSGLVKILNGESSEYTIELKGQNKIPGDEQSIKWTAEDSRISIAPSANIAQISAPPSGTGCTMSYIIASHNKCDVDKKILVMTADDIETLNSMKALYSDKLYYNIEVNESAVCMVDAVGFGSTSDEEGNELTSYDFSVATWTVKNPSIATVEKIPGVPLNAVVKGLKVGTTTVTASLENVTCDFTITVYPKGTVALEPEVYFTTNQNVININNIGDSKNAYVTAVNLSSNEFTNISWSSDNEDVISIIPNGTNATITAKKEGTAIINISHPTSQNILKIYVKVGSEYVISNNEPVTYISATDVITILRDEQPKKLQAVLVNYTGTEGEHFNFNIDNTSVAQISAQSPAGIAYIKPVGSGQAEITITNPVSEVSKKVLVVVGNSTDELAGITYLTTPNNVVTIGEGKTQTISVNVKNSENLIIDGYSWISSDYNIVDVISNGATASVKANSIGTAIITVSNAACKYPLEIIVHVVDPITASAHPYIQLTSSVLVLDIGDSYTSISADLIGGNDDDKANFHWSSNDSSICMVYGQNEVGKIKAVSEGTSYITVSHPKAEYSAQLLVVCEKKIQSECYISVPSSIINMKPTDESTSITATLINGTANDKYNFKWSLDVYDIVDFQYSANVCTIKPKQAGTATITISHPKADYDQQIIVSVQEYTTFSFPSTNITISQGEAKFLNMQVPVTSVKTHIEYFVKNEKICSVTGTRQVAQITGIDKGTTTVTAKLIASNTGAEQASSELMVYVKERNTTDAYITSTSTIYTLAKGKSQTLQATITGTDIIISDQANLQWSTSDSDIVEVTGLNSNGYVKGQSIYITAKKPGEAIITCSHDKASSSLEFYVVVPGTDKKIVTLNKSYVTLVKGNSGITLKANIENAESNDDYNNLQWTSVGPNGIDGNTICRVMGAGKEVQLYPVSIGEITVMAQLPDSDSVGKCTVIVQASKSLTIEKTGIVVMPFETKEIPYKVSPVNAIITWQQNTIDDYWTYKDMGCDNNGNGILQITGIKQPSAEYSNVASILMGTTDGGAAVKLTVKCTWNYSFVLDSTQINGNPDKNSNIQFTVNPPYANVEVLGGDGLFNATVKKDGTNSSSGIITFEPLIEGSDNNVIIRATNPNANNEVIGTYTIRTKFVYPSAEIKPDFKIIKDTHYSNGNTAFYSKMENSSIIIGDGEKATFSVAFEQKKLDPDIDASFTINPAFQTLVSIEDNYNGTYSIIHKQDVTKDAYRINTGYKPTYNGSPNYPDGSEISPKDFSITTWGSDAGERANGQRWKNSFYWSTERWYAARANLAIINTKNKTNVYTYTSPRNDYYYQWDGEESDDRPSTFTITKNNLSKNSAWGRVRDPSLDGTFISTDTFLNTPWYCFTAGNWKEYHYIKHNYNEILSDNIDITYLSVTEDTSVVSEVQVGNIKMNVTHAGIKEKTITIPIILRTRNCACTYKK